MCVSILTVSSPRHAHTRTHCTLAQTQRVPLCEIGSRARQQERAGTKHQHLPARGGGTEAACTGVGTRFLGTVAPVQDGGTVTKVKLVRGCRSLPRGWRVHRTRSPVHGGDSRHVAPDSPDLASGRPTGEVGSSLGGRRPGGFPARAAAAQRAGQPCLPSRLCSPHGGRRKPLGPRGCSSLDGAGALSRVVTHPSSPTAHIKNGLCFSPDHILIKMLIKIRSMSEPSIRRAQITTSSKPATTVNVRERVQSANSLVQ